MDKIRLVFPIALLAFIVLVFSEWFLCRKNAPSLPAKKDRFGRADSIAVIAITLCYAVTAFLNLGSSASPQSDCRFGSRGEYALVELPELSEVGGIMYFPTLHTGTYYVQFSADGEEWVDAAVMEQSYTDILKWRSADLDEGWGNVKFIRIISGSELWLGELALIDSAGRLMDSSTFAYPGGCGALFDEQDTVPLKASYLNSSYFDEIYHVRTAYEHIEAVEPYEISHPPLGKIIMGLGIRIFGLVPFGWRFMGTLTGCMMLPLLYVFVKRMFGGTAVPAAVTALMATDFMHFAQTRIATIDSYAVFFILLMYLFMYIYLQSDRSGRSWMLPLALSGLCFGLGAASKWTCIYAGAGLGLIWLIDRVERYLEARRLASAENEENPAEKSPAAVLYWRETWKNVAFCLVFFVAVPIAVYYLSYAPYGRAAGMEGLGMYFQKEYLDIVVENQKYMLSYHSGVNASHPYSSRWWQWLVDAKPILYYLDYTAEGTKSTIGAFVNPILCWGGLAAMLAMAYLAIAERDKKARFIVLGWLAQLLPWVFVTRITFAYHYFPSTLFLLLALGHVFDCIHRRSRVGRWLIWVFVGVSAVLFAVFYPVLSGAEISTANADKFLGWFELWPF